MRPVRIYKQADHSNWYRLHGHYLGNHIAERGISNESLVAYSNTADVNIS